MIHFRTLALLLLAAATACGGPVNSAPIETLVAPTPTPGALVPTPAPGATTTSAPGAPGVLQSSPTSLSFASINVAAQTLTASETGYTGAIAQASTCAGIATVSPAAGTGPQTPFTVTPVTGGTCSITFTDASNASVTVSVAVTTSGLNIMSTSFGGSK